ncbi:hypothetical protein AYI68_g1757 [Smittium mucronatum]|uniref:Uncharacterized protein n=1 Tax=Smittium mucronatum TaxID=133383 RepID=A0A1R0H4J3_9FUNG|nr:hypothetical protein AYI68_g1757 [Smittium mucronatum]
MESDPKQKIPQDVLELTRLLNDSSFSSSSSKDQKNPSSFSGHTNSELFSKISLLFSDSFIINLIEAPSALVFDTLDSTILLKNLLQNISLSNHLSNTQQALLISLYFNFIKLKHSSKVPDFYSYSNYPKFSSFNSNFHKTVNLLLDVLNSDLIGNSEKSLFFLESLLNLWNSKTSSTSPNNTDTAFVFDPLNVFNYQSVCKIVPDALYHSISSSNSLSSTILSSIKITFNQIFFYCTFNKDVQLSLNFVQQIIKLTSLPDFFIKNIFFNSSFMLDLYSDEYPLLSPKNVSSKKINGPTIQLLFIAGSSDKLLSRASSVLLTLVLQKIENHQSSLEEDKFEFSQFTASSQEILFEWLNSTAQSDKSRGLQAITSSFHAQNSKFGPNLLASKNLVSSIFDSYENDSPRTTLFLLNSIGSILTRNECRSYVLRYGSQFLSTFVFKITSFSKSSPPASTLDSEILLSAANVFSKLSTTETFSSDSYPQNNAPDLPTDTPSISELDSEDLNMPFILIPAIDLLNFYSEFLQSSNSLNLELVELIAEGLGYLSLQSVLKNPFCHSFALFSELLKYSSTESSSLSQNHSPKKTSHNDSALSISFALISIISNLVYRRPLLTEDEISAAKLRKAAMKKSKNESKDYSVSNNESHESLVDMLESSDSVNKRCLLLSKIGSDSTPHLLPFLVSSFKFINDGSSVSSSSTKIDLVIDAVHSFLFVPQLRGRFVQLGVVKNLVLNSTILEKSKPLTSKARVKGSFSIKEFETNSRDFIVAKSLSKIAISIPPDLAFPPSGSITANSLIPPFLSLCVSTSHDQLCIFEALLALTNFSASSSYNYSASSDSNAISHRDPAYDLVNTYHGLDVIDMLVLSSNKLIRRASVELICNLVATVETAFMHFISGSEDIPLISKASFDKISNSKLESIDIPSQYGISDKYRSHKLHLLAALSDIDFEQILHPKDPPTSDNYEFDSKTSLAALGAISTLVNHPYAARFLICCHPRFFSTIKSILKSDLYDFIYRAVVILSTTLSHLSETEITDRIKNDSEIVSLLIPLGVINSPKFKKGLLDIDGNKVPSSNYGPIIESASNCIQVLESSAQN